jgi:serine protease DegQ
MSSDGKSVVVVDVVRGSRAALAGMAQGDLVLSVNRRRVTDLEGLRGEMSTTGNQLLLQLQRGRSIFYLVLR